MDFTIGALVVLGGLIGGSTRFVVSDVVGRKLGVTFPWGTLMVNVSGTMVIGVFAGLASLPGSLLESASAHAFVVTGLLGGYTTVSSFSLQTLNLLLSDKTALAALNVAAHTILPPLAVAGGYDAVGWLAA
jgi:fluoride exporter